MGKWFPKVYDILMSPLERRKFGKIRKKLIEKAVGEVLEIGSGTGFNFPYYEHAKRVTAVEPEPRMRELSLPRAHHAQVPVEIILAGAEELPFPDDFFDTVVCTLVLCTIPNPTKALEEIRRVCKPEGQILLFEHVKIEHRILGQLQEWLTPFWKRICDGCHLNRNTLQLVNMAGFKVIALNQYYKGIFLVIEAINKKRSF